MTGRACGGAPASDQQIQRAALPAARHLQLHPPQLDQAVDHHLRRGPEAGACAEVMGLRGAHCCPEAGLRVRACVGMGECARTLCFAPASPMASTSSIAKPARRGMGPGVACSRQALLQALLQAQLWSSSIEVLMQPSKPTVCAALLQHSVHRRQRSVQGIQRQAAANERGQRRVLVLPHWAQRRDCCLR